jgi:hypothetical protein
MKMKENYKNIEQKMTPNGCVTRKVIIYKNGKGYKSISTHCPSTKHNKTVKKTTKSTRKTIRKPLTDCEIKQISKRKFIQNLFHDCK